MGGQGVWVTPECPTGDTLPWVLESSGNVVSLTFVVAHGFLCHQLDAASSHHIVELVQKQEPAGGQGQGCGRLGGRGSRRGVWGEVNGWQGGRRQTDLQRSCSWAAG